MQTVVDIESAVANLSEEDLVNFRRWFAEFDAQTWEKQFEEDVKAGKLHSLAQKAVSDFKANQFREL